MASRWDERSAAIVEAKAESGKPDVRRAWVHSFLNEIDLLPGEMYVKALHGMPDTRIQIGSATSKRPIELAAPIFLAPQVPAMHRACIQAAQRTGTVCIPHDNPQAVDAASSGHLVLRWCPDREGVSLASMRGACALEIVLFDPRGTIDRGTLAHFPGLTKDMDLVHAIDLMKEATSHELPVLVELPGQKPEDELIDAINAGADAVVLRDRPLNDLYGGEPSLHGLVAVKEIKSRVESIETKVLVVGNFGSSLDVVRALAMGADAVCMTIAPLIAGGLLDISKMALSEPGDGSANRLVNFMNATISEIKEILIHMGKSSVSKLGPGDLVAGTYEMAAVTGLPLSGHGKKLAMWMH